ncbi:hypothetical protein [Myroides odoratus]|uniref:hypothetical protein n=1 Tax=Myroides odoratus TaxID=256 RepID=UPI00333FD0AB
MLLSEVAFGVQMLNTIIKYLKMYQKKEQKGSKGKAESHRNTQPKDYGIMAGQIWWLRRVVVFALPPFGTYSVSFWFFRLSALLKWLSFFSVFFF